MNTEHPHETAAAPSQEGQSVAFIIIGLLLALLVGYLAWSAAGNRTAREEAEPQSSGSAQVGTPETPGTVALMTSGEPEDADGRAATLGDVTVTEVVSDRAFYVTDTEPAAERLLVLLARPLDDGAAENLVVARVGDRIAVSGTLQATALRAIEIAALPSADQAAVGSVTLYLRAQGFDVLGS